MNMFGVLCLGACLVATATPSLAIQRSDQEAARKGRLEGNLLPLRAIEARVVPMMAKSGAQYLGFDFDSATGIYTLKFLRNGKVIWVDIDGRSGQVISRTGD